MRHQRRIIEAVWNRAKISPPARTASRGPHEIPAGWWGSEKSDFRSADPSPVKRRAGSLDNPPPQALVSRPFHPKNRRELGMIRRYSHSEMTKLRAGVRGAARPPRLMFKTYP
jgi:hypothetical protein